MRDATITPGEFSRRLLQSLAASDGRRKRRKRNTTPDALGMEIKQGLLEAAVADDPDPEAFEEWLYARVQGAGGNTGAMRAMAQQVREEWSFAVASAGFRHWLEAGAPSDDAARVNGGDG